MLWGPIREAGHWIPSGQVDVDYANCVDTYSFSVNAPGSFCFLLSFAVSLPGNNPPHVLEENEQVHRIGRRGDEVEFLIEAPRFFVFRVNRKGTDASNVGRLERALHCVLQKCLTDALALPAVVYRQSR